MTESEYKNYEELPLFLNAKMIGEVLLPIRSALEFYNESQAHTPHSSHQKPL